MDRSVVEHDDHGALVLAGFGAVVMIEVFHKGREVGAAPGFGGGDDQLVGRAHHRKLSGPALRPTREGLRLAQHKPQVDRINLVGGRRSFRLCRGRRKLNPPSFAVNRTRFAGGSNF